jgi:hypothetical protein
LLGSPAGWRLFADVAGGVRSGRPLRGAASAENGGANVGSARVGDQREDDRGGSGVGDAAAAVQQQVTLALARLLAQLVEGERDE